VDRRVAPAVLVLAGALADLTGGHGLAFYVLVAAVPATAAAAIAALGEALDPAPRMPGTVAQAALGTLAAVLVLAAAASRAPLVEQGSVPPLATAALGACLIVLILQAAAGAAAELQGQGRRRVPRDLDERLDQDERRDRDPGAEEDPRLQQPLRRGRAA
jgi:hypothetical protein